ncbi:uncharacterized protein LOC8031960 [Ixodes scapularis]|uniref:uncharacterized protein LOC8031960 n=1 Tax=Ixodes scapularis TaxID=6945 RepID=UPI001A9CC993|nr:uncharacterized protein LOC8031960 [Ixodes scapularis]
MSGSDASVYLSAVRWDDSGLPLQEFVHKFREPQVGRVIRGQYRHVGVPSLSSPSLSSVLFLSPLGPRLRISAQCVKFKENRRVSTIGPRLAIPDSYKGWFEILSEDGRSSRCFESVAELLRRSPETCLVREAVKAHLAHPDDPETVTDKTRTLPLGETLVVIREVRASLGRLRSTHGRFLRCLTSGGDTVYLAAESRGKFSPIAKEGNISGVHTVRTLLCKRFPLMVRLVHGRPASGLKTSELRLYGIEREDYIMAMPLIKDAPPVTIPQSAFLKLQAPKNADVLVTLPEYARLSDRCNRLVDRMDAIEVLETTRSSSDIIRTPPYRSISEPNSKSQTPTSPTAAPAVERLQSTPAPDDYRYEEIDQIYDYVRGFAPLPEKIKAELQGGGEVFQKACPTSGTTTVASGSARERPLPPPIETIPARRYSLATDPGPNPPPAVVLKSTKSKDTDSHIYEAVTRRSEERASRGSVIPSKVALRSVPKPPNNKLFVKSTHPVRNGKQRIFRNAAVPIKDVAVMPCPVPHHDNHHNGHPHHHHPNNKGGSSAILQKVARAKTCRGGKAGAATAANNINNNNSNNNNNNNNAITTSPLFNIRYKSLTNLAVDFNDTLDSSNSGGGRASSGGSGSKGSKERSPPPHKLSRPKSLSNLFWDVEVNNKYNLLHSNELKANQFIYADLPAKLAASERSGKRVGTLYL